MAIRVIVDNSVFLRACTASEPGHAEALAFMLDLRERSKRGEVEVHQPAAFLFEFFAAYHRGQSARDVFQLFRGTAEPDQHIAHEIHAVTKDDALRFFDAHRAAFPGMPPKGGGTDLVYVALALKLGATLVTCDEALFAYSELIRIVRPTDFAADPTVGRGQG